MNTSLDLGQVPGWLWVVIGLLTALELALAVWALVVLFRTPQERVVFDKRWIWVLVILFFNLVGPIVFLVAGRKPAVAADPLGQGAPAVARADAAAKAAEVLYGPDGGRAPDSRTPGGGSQ